jgi:hypothetical protein
LLLNHLNPKVQADENNITSMFNVLLNAGGGNNDSWFGTQNKAHGGSFFLYRTTAAANADLTKAQQISGKANGASFIADSPSTAPGTTVIIITPSIAFALPVNNVTAHELGHYLDKFGASAGGGTGSQTLSDTALYSEDEFGIYDMPAFDAYLNCTVTNQGVFDGQTDYEGRPICQIKDGVASLTSIYAGRSNLDVMTTAWPIYQSNDTHLYSEFFAEEFAVISSNYVQGTVGYGRQDTYLGNRSDEFQCTKSVVSSLLNNGTITIYQPCYPYPPEK